MRPEQTRNRKRIVEMSYEAKTAHLGSALSAVDIIEAVYSIKGPEDKFVLSNGHAAVALYAVLEGYGLLSDPTIEELGVHPDRNPNLGIEVSTGSLGQGLPIAVGMALAEREKNVYCCVSDGECAEGSVWEALRIAHEQQLDNLKIIVNANGFDASDPVDLEILLARLQAQGCAVLVADGHDLNELTDALSLKILNVPLVIFAKTNVEQLPMLSGLAAHYKILSVKERDEALYFLERGLSKTPEPKNSLGHRFFREKARELDVHPNKMEQLKKLCTSLAGNDDFFLIPQTDFHSLEAFRLEGGGWVIRLLRTIEGYEGGASSDYFSYFFLGDTSLESVHLMIGDYNVKRTWWWDENRPTFAEFETEIEFGHIPSRETLPGDNGHGRSGPQHLISLFQARLMEKTASARNRGLVTSEYTLRRDRKCFRDFVRTFVETCRLYPDEMAGMRISLGDDYWLYGRAPSLTIGLDAMGECGLRLDNGQPVPKLRKTIDPLRFGEGFGLISQRVHHWTAGWLSPTYYLTFKNEDVCEEIRHAGTKIKASKSTLQLRTIAAYLVKNKGDSEFSGSQRPPLKITRFDDELLIEGEFDIFPEKSITVRNKYACLIYPDGSAQLVVQPDGLWGDEVGFVKWLIGMTQASLLDEMVSSCGISLFDFSRRIEDVGDTVAIFVRACRDNPDLMSGAEIRVGRGGRVDFFVSNIGRAILAALGEVGLIDSSSKLKTNPAYFRMFRTKTVQLGEQFKLSVINNLSERDVDYVLSFKERQL